MMNDDRNNLKSVERRLQRFFQKQAESLKASKDLWSKLESRLGEKLKDTDANTKRGLSRWLAGPVGCSLSLRIGSPDTDSCRLGVVNNKSYSQ